MPCLESKPCCSNGCNRPSWKAQSSLAWPAACCCAEDQNLCRYESGPWWAIDVSTFAKLLGDTAVGTMGNAMQLQIGIGASSCLPILHLLLVALFFLFWRPCKAMLIVTASDRLILHGHLPRPRMATGANPLLFEAAVYIHARHVLSFQCHRYIICIREGGVVCV